MKILLSPAKLMSTDTDAVWAKSTTPQFLEHSERIMETLKTYSVNDLVKLMKISKDLAETNYQRNTQWKTKPSKTKGVQAGLAFQGEVYRGLDAKSLNEEAQSYLNQNLFILSGLYGILRPSDKIMLYRLEMGTRLDVNGSKNLYGFWKEILTEHINQKTKKNEIILNLSSNEYIKAIDSKKLKAQKVDVEFYDYKNGELKQIMVYFKQARGKMAKYCALNNINSLDELKLFNEDNYSFDDKLSEENKLVFIR